MHGSWKDPHRLLSTLTILYELLTSEINHVDATRPRDELLCDIGCLLRKRAGWRLLGWREGI